MGDTACATAWGRASRCPWGAGSCEVSWGRGDDGGKDLKGGDSPSLWFGEESAAQGGGAGGASRGRNVQGWPRGWAFGPRLDDGPEEAQTGHCLKLASGPRGGGWQGGCRKRGVRRRGSKSCPSRSPRREQDQPLLVRRAQAPGRAGRHRVGGRAGRVPRCGCHGVTSGLEAWLRVGDVPGC